MSTADAVQEISDWLIGQGLSEGSYDQLLAAFSERLNEAGIVVQRSMMALRTLHPTIDARGFVWRQGAAAEIENFTTDRGPTQAFLDSPLAYLLQNRDIREVQRPLSGPNATFDFPVLKELRDEGITD